MEEKNEITLAVLSRDIHHVTLSITELKQQLAQAANTHVTRDEIRSLIDTQGKLHDDIERRLRTLDTRNEAFANDITSLNTSLKIWLAVGGAIIGIVQGVILLFISKII